jgi:asparagine synthase (glutamine-hydrolysing)
MCGIAGYITDGMPVLNRDLIQSMCDRISYRGPDGSGYLIDGSVALGHRRLSIIDAGGGTQPLGNEDGTIQVIFNGEIYNYRELRADLLKRGHRFTSNSDTEVLVHLYEEVGERLPEYLNGMFAFAIWDRRQQVLFLARDRFGEKPLYYTDVVPGMRFCFASELKALREIPDFPTSVNYRSVSDMIALDYVPDPDTIYANVFKLRPSHSLTLDRRGVRIRRYWAPVFQIDPNRNFVDTAEELREIFGDSVERRMISDVPLGAFLSGGVDSSSVVAFMARRAPDRVKTFSIGFTKKEVDETRFARMVAERYQTDHHELIVSPDILEVLDTLVDHYDEPFGDSSAIPTLYLAKMTRQHVTVALSGDGADEIFGGYRRYRYGVLESRLRSIIPRWFRHSVIRVGAHCYPKFDYLPRVLRAKSLLTCLSQELADAYFTSISSISDNKLDELLSPELVSKLDGYRPRMRFRKLFEGVRHLGPLEQFQSVDFETYLPGDILVKMDRASMAYSLEARAPVLDHRLAELAFSMPSDFKLKGSVGKHVWKQAVAGDLPAAVITRTKLGFNAPLAHWFGTSLKRIFEATVLQSSMQEYLCMDLVRRLWREHQSGIRNHDRKLWNLLMLAQWDARHRKASGRSAMRQGVLT